MKKKTIMTLLSMAVVVVLSGCGADTKEDNSVLEEDVAVVLREEVPALAQTAEAVEAETTTMETESVVEQVIHKPELEVTPIEEVWYTEDGTQVLLTATCRKVEVKNEGFDVLAQALSEWSELIYNEVLAEAEECASWAAEHYAFLEDPTQFIEYYTSIDFGPARVDDVVVSLSGGHEAYTGGAHGNYGFVGYTFDVETGELLTLDRLIADDEGFQEAAIQEILAVLEAEPYVSMIFADYESTVRGLFAQDGYVSWYLSEEGIVITLDPYEVGPYSMGSVEINLPYEDFSQYMALKYRPKM